jgi:dephospho-CoA kinase
VSDRYPGKTIIGLTGNIATGKSVVRRMLEHLGAFGIDADGLSHRAMSPGAPAYKPVAQMFGRWVVNSDGQINRERLSRIVFNDPEALATLESMVHPTVRQAVNILIRRSKSDLVVVEAIKLLDSPLADICDAVWVVDAPEEVRLRRLMKDRNLSAAEAKMRMDAQEPQADKLAKASTIINNGAGYEVTYEQVQKHLKALLGDEKASVEPEEKVVERAPEGEMQITVKRGSPRDVQAIASFLNAHNGSSLSGEDVMYRFGEQAYMLAMGDGDVMGLAGLQVENLIARVSEFFIADRAPVKATVNSLVTTLEDAIGTLQGEIAMIFIPDDAPEEAKKEVLRAGYEQVAIAELKIPDWREAASEAAPDNATLFAKRMRADRVLKPL